MGGRWLGMSIHPLFSSPSDLPCCLLFCLALVTVLINLRTVPPPNYPVAGNRKNKMRSSATATRLSSPCSPHKYGWEDPHDVITWALDWGGIVASNVPSILIPTISMGQWTFNVYTESFCSNPCHQGCPMERNRPLCGFSRIKGSQPPSRDVGVAQPEARQVYK